LLVGVGTSSTGIHNLPDGAPPDREYADWAWNWIEETIAASGDFEFLFVTGHYQTVDSRGEYNKALNLKLVPLMQKYKVSAYIQGHRHTIEHIQHAGFENADDVHVFGIGAGSLTNWVLEECNQV